MNDDQRLANDRPDHHHVTPQEWGCLREAMREIDVYQFWRTYTYLMPQAAWEGDAPAPTPADHLARIEARTRTYWLQAKP